MAKWLQRQEAIDLRTVYLRWCAELSPHNETDSLDKDVTDEEDDNEDVAEVNDQVTTKTPDMTQAYGASEFLPALKTFIQEKFTSHALLPNAFDRYNVYKAVHLMLPSKPHVSDRKCQKKIHATPECSNGPRKQPSPARFDTALVIEDVNLHCKEGGLHDM
ncbi:hypothetical protein PILCRDRAFT_8320 [Piloderma croceum F 1598]|uniref:Uncharacterized protein n=1 Tax=Piloderma croceum (strain F 1598) TaxID=765440 RepID=A0A0C3FQS9_PILCF|nr:hypothetical protein PILCRDRAFT_8320 [Piloderma croceum F 1598]